MLAMLIILVTLLVQVAILVLTANARLVPVAAIRAGLNRADMGAWDAGYEIKQAQATESAAFKAASSARLAHYAALKAALSR